MDDLTELEMPEDMLLETVKVTALAGGVGGARMVDGLARCLPPENLSVVVNVGDDFDLFGLRICPDLDTVCYTLAGIANQDTGWGIQDETWHVMESLTQVGGPDWFRLGDHDLATHLERTRLLKQGQTLSQVCRAFCAAWGVDAKVMPASDDPVPTRVLTDEGELAFQDYFVRRKCQPKVSGFRFNGVEQAALSEEARGALNNADVVLICPSNPWVSIDPILAIPGVRHCLTDQLVLAVSPLIGGRAVKGPAAKMYAELEIEPSALSVARHYGTLLDGFIIDRQDAALANRIRAEGMQVLVTDTLMKTIAVRQRLASDILRFAFSLRKQQTRNGSRVQSVKPLEKGGRRSTSTH